MANDRKSGPTPPTSVAWTGQVKAALDAEAKRRNAAQVGQWPPGPKWTRGMVAEDILREALGVGNE